MKLGVWIFALASVCAGIFDLIWREFEPAHQPIHALADNIPGEPILAALAAAVLILGGVAILRQRTARIAAVALGLVYLLFALFWLPRFFTATKYLGLHFNVINGVLNGVATQVILVAAAYLVFTSSEREGSRARAIQIARWVFGLSSLDFGIAHLAGVRFVATMIPAWMPLGASFWVVLTGIAFVLAGLAILARKQDVLAARLLALMLICFSLFLLIPGIFAQPHSHIAWGSNAYNLTAAGAVLIFSEALSQKQLILTSC
jgi:uncharacterized membrane protein